MAKRRTTNATSGYRGGMKTASTGVGGKIGRNSRYVSRRQRYYDMRIAFGRSGG